MTDNQLIRSEAIAASSDRFGEPVKPVTLTTVSGLFKLFDPREQAARYFMLLGLARDVEVWVLTVPEEFARKDLEKRLLTALGSSLRLDGSAKGSWMKLQMTAWRASGRPMLRC